VRFFGLGVVGSCGRARQGVAGSGGQARRGVAWRPDRQRDHEGGMCCAERVSWYTVYAVRGVGGCSPELWFCLSCAVDFCAHLRVQQPRCRVGLVYHAGVVV
jgi:hypothetical protein